MNKNPKWLWLVLLPSVQLVVLLLAVLVLFDWLRVVTTRFLDQQACLETVETGNALLKNLNYDSIFIGTDVDQEFSQQLKQQAQQCGTSGRQQIAFWKAHAPQPMTLRSANDEVDLSEIQFQPIRSITDGSSLGTVSELSHSNRKQLTGWTKKEGRMLFVNALFIPQLNGVILVAQQPSSKAIGLLGLIGQTKEYAYKLTLFIGIISIGFTVIMVSRLGRTVNHLSDGLEKAVSDSASEILKTKNAVIFGLAKLAESRDNDTGEHLERIRIYVTILAEDLALTRPEFDQSFIHDLALASSLHDVGKVGIPDSILLKPGRLSPEERGIMEIHTLIGGECLDAIQARLGDNDFMSIARQIAYYHHERWDGTGYPHALKKDEIPLVARIVAVADVYDALTSKRPYKKAMTHAESKEIIMAGSGKHFDPEIVEAFLRHEEEFEAISLRQQFLSDDEATSNFQRLCEAVGV